MMRCKDVSTLLSTGGLEAAGWRTRLAVRLHLSMCRHCRAFRRQLASLTGVARGLSIDHEAEPARDFEARLSEHLANRRADEPRDPGNHVY